MPAQNQQELLAVEVLASAGDTNITPLSATNARAARNLVVKLSILFSLKVYRAG